MSPRLRFGIAAAVVVFAVAGLIGFSLSSATDYYRTPAQLLSGSYKTNQRVRVAGIVVKGTVVHNGPQTTFRIVDAGVSIPVTTAAVLPDIFAPGLRVVAEGAMRSDGVFSAADILAKCPSKFSAKVST